MKRLPKAFTSNGKREHSIEVFFYILAINGALVSLFGTTQQPPQPYFVLGSLMLLLSAMHFRMPYFIALELILLAGHGAIMLGIGAKLQLALPILLCFQLTVYMVLTGQLRDQFTLLATVAIALLSIGFAYNNQWIFLVGSTAIAIYAFVLRKANPPALIWSALNAGFSLVAVLRLFQLSY